MNNNIKNTRKTPNLTGWGNKLNALTDAQTKEAIAIRKVKGMPYKQLGALYGVSESTVWRSIQKVEAARANKIGHYGNFTDSYRMAACQVAVKYGYRMAADIFGCSVGSIYNWVKVYDMTSSYFNRSK